MERIKLSIFVAVAIFLVAYFSSLAVASHYDACEDFPEEKQEDCEYIIDADFEEEYEEEALDLLLEDSDDEYIWETPESNNIGLRILTNKLTYKVGDSIEIDIFPKNTIISLSYGGKTTQTADNADFIANSQYSTITANYDDVTYKRYVNVVETDRLIFTWKVFVFGLFNYFIFSLTKFSMVIKWLRVV